jgi:GT2 family glycosyltransferase
MRIENQHHVLVVEAYEGCLEFLTGDREEWELSRGHGLPLEEIAEALDCRITVLSWDEWPPYELKETWSPVPATIPLNPEDLAIRSLEDFESNRVRRIPIPAKDPEHGLPFSEKGPSPRSYGLINDSGLLFFISCCLHDELRAVHAVDPFQAAILPMWGGVGYVAQMSRATLAPDAIQVPFAVVVTDSSANRQRANQEGLWTRHAVIRRQMEDVSLALADLAIVFGPRGERLALSGRLPDSPPPLFAPRFVKARTIEAIDEASRMRVEAEKQVQFFRYGPQQASSGALAMLEAVSLSANMGIRLSCPFISAGPPMMFAPMRPRSFEDYWCSRGFASELKRQGQWEWRRDYPERNGRFFIRFYPTLFDHLPAVWDELARRSLLVLSPASAEGLAPGRDLPQEILVPGEPEPVTLAQLLQRLAAADIATLDRIRRDLCAGVVAAHRGSGRARLFEDIVQELSHLILCPPLPQDLSRVALMFLDRRITLQIHAEKETSTVVRRAHLNIKKDKLSAVVTCYEMGSMVRETVESVWASTRLPDEVLLIDDGSHGEETLEVIKDLERTARHKGLPLKVIHQKNQGLASARNTGLHAAEGEFISFVDGDDLLDPRFYFTTLQILEKYPRLGGVAAWASIFGEECAAGLWNAPQAELPFLFSENSVVVPCMMRTGVIRELGGYDVQQRYNYEDWELSVRLLASGWPIVTVPMHLMHYRVRSDSLYRHMTSVQNQVMRELMLSSHRETVSRFSVEIAMLMENRLMEHIHPALDPRHKVKQPVSRRSFFAQASASARTLREHIFSIWAK